MCCIPSRMIATAVSAVEREGGTALTFGGDSLLASFGAAIAIEDASLRACRAALAFQAAITENSRLPVQKIVGTSTESLNTDPWTKFAKL